MALLHSVSKRQRLVEVKFDVCKKRPKLIMITVATSLERSQNKRQINYLCPYIYQNWIVSRDNCPDMAIFAVFFTKVQKINKRFYGDYTKHHWICIRYSHVQCVSKLPTGLPIFQSVSEWQREKKNYFVCEKRRFCNFNWLQWQHLSRDRQINAGFIKALHSSSNPEILVKIRLAVPEIDLLRGQLLNFFKVKKKHWQNM